MKLLAALRCILKDNGSQARALESGARTSMTTTPAALPGSSKPAEETSTTTLDTVGLLVVHDPADEARAAQLVSALETLVKAPIRAASTKREAQKEVKRADVAVVLVSEALQANAAPLEVAATSLPQALVPVVIDESLLAQKETWRGAIAQTMPGELYFDFCDPGRARVAELVRLIAAKVPRSSEQETCDVFLSHEWKAHAEARIIAQHLKKRGLRVWLDEEQMSGSLNASMSSGIERSTVFLVIATKRYMKKVNDGDRADNCLKEFLYAGDKRFERIVVAALEPDMVQASSAWTGPFKLALSRQRPVDLTDLSDAALAGLAEAIEQRIRVPEASAATRLSPRMRDIYALLNPCSSVAWVEGKAARFSLGTRTWILDAMCEWYVKQESPVFVLMGEGGVGKSTIMAEVCFRGDALHNSTAADEAHRRRSSRVRALWRRSGKERPGICVAAYHFFRHDEVTAGSAEGALLSIAWQLCESVPGFADALEHANLEDVRKRSLPDVFKAVLWEPMHELASDRPRQVVVIDALDECSASGAFVDKVIRTWKSSMPAWLSLMVSTRPEGEIQRQLKNNHLKPELLELQDDENYADVGLHIDHVLRSMGDVVDPADVDACVAILKERSQGLFLWASFLPETLLSLKKRKGAPLTVEDIRSADSIPAGLGGMFEEYFSRLRDKVEGQKMYEALLAPMLAAREPLSIDQFQHLLPGVEDEYDAKLVLGKGQTLIHRFGNGTYALIHKRMADWLLDGEQSGDLRVKVKRGHERLAAYCRTHDDDFALQHAVYHLVSCRQEDVAFELLNNFSWVQKAIMRGGDENQRRLAIGALVRDCVKLGVFESDKSETPRLLSKALNTLSRHPLELASQVLARTGEEDSQGLVQTLQQPKSAWLEPVATSLPSPRDSLVAVLEGHADRVLSVAFSDDLIFSGSYDQTIRVWDAVTGKELDVLEGHTGAVTSVAADGGRVVSGSYDTTARIWDANDGRILHVLQGHTDSITSVAMDGGRLITGGRDCQARVWDVETGALLSLLEGHEMAILGVALAGDRAVTGGKDRTVRVWHALSGQQQLVLQGHTGKVRCASLCDDVLVSGSDDHTVRIWNAHSGAPVAVLAGHTGCIRGVVLTGNRIVSGSEDRTVRVWDRLTGSEMAVFEGHSGFIRGVAVSGNRVVSGSLDRTVRIWNADLGATTTELNAHSNAVTSLAVSGNRVVSGSYDTVFVWDAQSGTKLAEMKGHANVVWSVAILGDRVVSGSLDHTVGVWDTHSGAEIAMLQGHAKAVYCVAINEDYIVSGSLDCTVRVWSADTCAEVSVLQGHARAVYAVTLCGNRVVSGSEDTTVRIWHAESGEELRQLRGHAACVQSVAMSNGRIVSGSDDGTVRLWDAETGAKLKVVDLPGHVSKVKIHDGRVWARFWETDGEVKEIFLPSASTLSTGSGKASGFPDLLPLAVESESHLAFGGEGTVGFSADNRVTRFDRQGKVLAVGDAGGFVHLLRFRKAKRT